MTEQELKAALMIKRKLERKRGTLKDLETGGYQSGLGGVGHGRRASTDAEDAAELAEKIKKLECELEKEKDYIRRRLEKIPLDDIEREIITLRYVECLEWKSVQRRSAYEKSQAHEIKNRALEKIFSGKD